MTDVLKLFGKETAAWFSDTLGTPTPVQEEGWPAIASGSHVLISAPTGTGKTLSAFLVAIDRLKAQAREDRLAEALQVIYVSPLKALGNDIQENLRRPLEGIAGPDLRIAVRNGDTTAAQRQRMIKTPPHILITTPESLYLLLTSKGGQGLLCSANTIILDELHAVINTKRGAHMMLSLARLDRLCGKPLQRIGLSATIEPLSQAAEYLAVPDPVTVVAPKMEKKKDIQVLSPLPDMRILPEGTIWPELGKAVYMQCQGARTVIAFLEGRAQAEKLAYHVNLIAGEGFARTHHGCVSKEQRLEAEHQLRSGELRLLCATSSMELGIDVGEVDKVLQVGFPSTISGTMQRLGRAGHNPGRVSVMRMFPRTAAEGVYCGLTADVALSGGIEKSHPPRKCLDVLAQHLVSMAATEPYTLDEAMNLLGRAYPFLTVTREELENVLRMLAGDFEHELDHPARPRLLYDRIHSQVSGDNYTRMLAVSAGGTIPDRGFFSARLADGTKLGELDEEYVFEARVGDKFLLGSFAWKINEIGHDSVIVSPSSFEGAQIPFWRGDWSGRTYETALAFGNHLRGLEEAHSGGRLYEALRALHLSEDAAENAERFLDHQIKETGSLPSDKLIVVEHFADKAGEHQVMIHSLFGRRVNTGLALLLEEVAKKATGMEVSCFDDDDGILLFPYGGEADLPEGLLQALDPARARAILTAKLPMAPLFNMAFRYNAARALMMGLRQGKRLPLWIQRLRGAKVLEGAVTQKDHPLMMETKRECLEDYLDLPAIEDVLKKIRSGAIAIREIHIPEPSPMSLPLRREAEAVLLYDYFPTPGNVARVVDQDLGEEEMIAPAEEQLERVSTRLHQPKDAMQLHSLLMAEGDIVAGEVEAPVQWLKELSRQGRALYIEPGLWICAEQEEQYHAALVEGDLALQLRLVRRCLRYRGAQSAETLSERYFWPVDHCRQLLTSLVDTGIAVENREMYYHAEMYTRAQRATVSMRRKQVETMPPDRYQALLCQGLRLRGTGEEQLRHGLSGLLDKPFTPALWEGVLLPARVTNYRPAMMDEVMAQGELFWQFQPGEKPALAFHRYEDIDWEAGFLAQEAALDPKEEALVAALAARGASFAQGLGSLVPEGSALNVLLSLMAKGLVRADSFIPVRQWLEGDKNQQASLRQRMRGRALATTSGRWELTRPLKARSDEEILEREFGRAILLSKETIDGLPWARALEVLRLWEYTGRVRRGYFIQGLSGAQFMRDEDYRRALLSMEQPSEDILWFSGADPAQQWGKALPHQPDASFMNVPGTAVALYGGLPVAVMERQGAVLRILQPEKMEDALAAFAREFEQKRIFPGKRSITVKEYPKEAEAALSAAGFRRQMLDYELWRKHI